MQPGIWSLYRGRQDGERWASTEAHLHELREWADLPSFQSYMGAMPFPYYLAKPMAYYQQAQADAERSGLAFDHNFYSQGFLEAVYEAWNSPLEERP